MTVPDNMIALVCFAILSENDDGIVGKYPSWLEEKSKILMCGKNAFGWLDYHNQKKLIQWAKHCGVELPVEIVHHFQYSEQAYFELLQKGIEM